MSVLILIMSLFLGVYFGIKVTRGDDWGIRFFMGGTTVFVSLLIGVFIVGVLHILFRPVMDVQVVAEINRPVEEIEFKTETNTHIQYMPMGNGNFSVMPRRSKRDVVHYRLTDTGKTKEHQLDSIEVEYTSAPKEFVKRQEVVLPEDSNWQFVFPFYQNYEYTLYMNKTD